MSQCDDDVSIMSQRDETVYLAREDGGHTRARREARADGGAPARHVPAWARRTRASLLLRIPTDPLVALAPSRFLKNALDNLSEQDNENRQNERNDGMDTCFSPEINALLSDGKFRMGSYMDYWHQGVRREF
jgi:hypothetical protein